jgi:hypothetical protein
VFSGFFNDSKSSRPDLPHGKKYALPRFQAAARKCRVLSGGRCPTAFM